MERLASRQARRRTDRWTDRYAWIVTVCKYNEIKSSQVSATEIKYTKCKNVNYVHLCRQKQRKNKEIEALNEKPWLRNKPTKE